jgi:hypothetical protein
MGRQGIKIAIQDSGILSSHTSALVGACNTLGLTYECFGLTSSDLTGSILEDDSSTIIPFGSTKLLKRYHAGLLPKNWLVWHNIETFQQNNINLPSWMLNSDAEYYKFPECADLTFAVDKFVKPAGDLKLFNAAVLQKGTSVRQLLKDTDSSIYELNDTVLVASVKTSNITKEFRCFVIGEDVFISQYMSNGLPEISDISVIDQWIIPVTAKIHRPVTGPYVVDVCDFNSGISTTSRIIEYNAFQVSGFYGCDAVPILESLVENKSYF